MSEGGWGGEASVKKINTLAFTHASSNDSRIYLTLPCTEAFTSKGQIDITGDIYRNGDLYLELLRVSPGAHPGTGCSYKLQVS